MNYSLEYREPTLPREHLKMLAGPGLDPLFRGTASPTGPRGLAGPLFSKIGTNFAFCKGRLRFVAMDRGSAIPEGVAIAAVSTNDIERLRHGVDTQVYRISVASPDALCL